MSNIDTLPKLLRRNYEKYGERKIAMRKKDHGVWKQYTWKDYYLNVKYFSVGPIINIDFQNVGNWVERKRIPYTTFTDLSQKPQVHNLIRKDVERVDSHLPEKARV